MGLSDEISSLNVTGPNTYKRVSELKQGQRGSSPNTTATLGLQYRLRWRLSFRSTLQFRDMGGVYSISSGSSSARGHVPDVQSVVIFDLVKMIPHDAEHSIPHISMRCNLTYIPPLHRL